jgi:hypothetical protein
VPGVSNEDQIKFVTYGDINGAQSWSFGIWTGVATTGTPTSTDLNNALTVINTPLTAFWNTYKTKNLATVRLLGFKAYFYPTGSAVATLVAQQAITPAPGTGTQGTSPRNALVVSLLTGSSGRSYRGRFYVPYTGVISGSNLQAVSSDVDAVANGAAALLGSMKTAALGGPWGNCPPRVRSEKLGLGLIVTSIKTDSLIDTQRRREDKLSAAYFKTNTI